MHQFTRCRAGFSLIELLIVVAIFALLVGITIPAVQKVRASAARAACGSHFRQLGLATQSYIALQNKFPEGVSFPYSKSKADLDSHIGVSWLTQLLPHLEQDAIATEVVAAHRTDPTGDTKAHSSICDHSIAAFRCPADGRIGGSTNNGQRWGLTNFLGVAGTAHQFYDGILHRNHITRVADVADGTSNTLYAGERPTGPDGWYGAWYARWGIMLPQQNQLLAVQDGVWLPNAVNCTGQAGVYYAGRYDDACDLNHYWSLHPGGANFAFGDGSVRFLGYSANSVLPALATRAGTESAVVPE